MKRPALQNERVAFLMNGFSGESLYNFKMKAFRDTKYRSYFNFRSLNSISKDQLYRISGSQFYEWLFMPDKFLELLKNGPLAP